MAGADGRVQADLAERGRGPDAHAPLRLTAHPLQLWKMAETDEDPRVELQPLHIGVKVGAAADQHAVRTGVGNHPRRLSEALRGQIPEGGQSHHDSATRFNEKLTTDNRSSPAEDRLSVVRCRFSIE